MTRACSQCDNARDAMTGPVPSPPRKSSGQSQVCMIPLTSHSEQGRMNGSFGPHRPVKNEKEDAKEDGKSCGRHASQKKKEGKETPPVPSPRASRTRDLRT